MLVAPGRLPPVHVGARTSMGPNFWSETAKARPPAPVRSNFLRHAPHNAFSLAKAQAVASSNCNELSLLFPLGNSHRDSPSISIWTEQHMAWPVHVINFERREVEDISSYLTAFQFDEPVHQFTTSLISTPRCNFMALDVSF